MTPEEQEELELLEEGLGRIARRAAGKVSHAIRGARPWNLGKTNLDWKEHLYRRDRRGKFVDQNKADPPPAPRDTPFDAHVTPDERRYDPKKNPAAQADGILDPKELSRLVARVLRMREGEHTPMHDLIAAINRLRELQESRDGVKRPRIAEANVWKLRGEDGKDYWEIRYRAEGGRGTGFKIGLRDLYDKEDQQYDPNRLLPLILGKLEDVVFDDENVKDFGDGFCACGCGSVLPRKKDRRDYVPGHDKRRIKPKAADELRRELDAADRAERQRSPAGMMPEDDPMNAPDFWEEVSKRGFSETFWGRIQAKARGVDEDGKPIPPSFANQQEVNEYIRRRWRNTLIQPGTSKDRKKQLAYIAAFEEWADEIRNRKDELGKPMGLDPHDPEVQRKYGAPMPDLKNAAVMNDDKIGEIPPQVLRAAERMSRATGRRHYVYFDPARVKKFKNTDDGTTVVDWGNPDNYVISDTWQVYEPDKPGSRSPWRAGPGGKDVPNYNRHGLLMLRGVTDESGDHSYIYSMQQLTRDVVPASSVNALSTDRLLERLAPLRRPIHSRDKKRVYVDEEMLAFDELIEKVVGEGIIGEDEGKAENLARALAVAGTNLAKVVGRGKAAEIMADAPKEKEIMAQLRERQKAIAQDVVRNVEMGKGVQGLAGNVVDTTDVAQRDAAIARWLQDAQEFFRQFKTPGQKANKAYTAEDLLYGVSESGADVWEKISRSEPGLMGMGITGDVYASRDGLWAIATKGKGFIIFHRTRSTSKWGVKVSDFTGDLGRAITRVAKMQLKEEMNSPNGVARAVHDIVRMDADIDPGDQNEMKVKVEKMIDEIIESVIRDATRQRETRVAVRERKQIIPGQGPSRPIQTDEDGPFAGKGVIPDDVPAPSGEVPDDPYFERADVDRPDNPENLPVIKSDDDDDDTPGIVDRLDSEGRPLGLADEPDDTTSDEVDEPKLQAEQQVVNPNNRQIAQGEAADAKAQGRRAAEKGIPKSGAYREGDYTYYVISEVYTDDEGKEWYVERLLRRDTKNPDEEDVEITIEQFLLVEDHDRKLDNIEDWDQGLLNKLARKLDRKNWLEDEDPEDYGFKKDEFVEFVVNTYGLWAAAKTPDGRWKVFERKNKSSKWEEVLQVNKDQWALLQQRGNKRWQRDVGDLRRRISDAIAADYADIVKWQNDNLTDGEQRDNIRSLARATFDSPEEVEDIVDDTMRTIKEQQRQRAKSVQDEAARALAEEAKKQIEQAAEDGDEFAAAIDPDELRRNNQFNQAVGEVEDTIEEVEDLPIHKMKEVNNPDAPLAPGDIMRHGVREWHLENGDKYVLDHNTNTGQYLLWFVPKGSDFEDMVLLDDRLELNGPSANRHGLNAAQIINYHAEGAWGPNDFRERDPIFPEAAEPPEPKSSAAVGDRGGAWLPPKDEEVKRYKLMSDSLGGYFVAETDRKTEAAKDNEMNDDDERIFRLVHYQADGVDENGNPVRGERNVIFEHATTAENYEQVLKEALEEARALDRAAYGAGVFRARIAARDGDVHFGDDPEDVVGLNPDSLDKPLMMRDMDGNEWMIRFSKPYIQRKHNVGMRVYDAQVVKVTPFGEISVVVNEVVPYDPLDPRRLNKQHEVARRLSRNVREQMALSRLRQHGLGDFEKMREHLEPNQIIKSPYGRGDRIIGPDKDGVVRYIMRYGQYTDTSTGQIHHLYGKYEITRGEDGNLNIVENDRIRWNEEKLFDIEQFMLHRRAPQQGDEPGLGKRERIYVYGVQNNLPRNRGERAIDDEEGREFKEVAEELAALQKFDLEKGADAPRRAWELAQHLVIDADGIKGNMWGEIVDARIVMMQVPDPDLPGQMKWTAVGFLDWDFQDGKITRYVYDIDGYKLRPPQDIGKVPDRDFLKDEYGNAVKPVPVWNYHDGFIDADLQAVHAFMQEKAKGVAVKEIEKPQNKIAKKQARDLGEQGWRVIGKDTWKKDGFILKRQFGQWRVRREGEAEVVAGHADLEVALYRLENDHRWKNREEAAGVIRRVVRPADAPKDVDELEDPADVELAKVSEGEGDPDKKAEIAAMFSRLKEQRDAAKPAEIPQQNRRSGSEDDRAYDEEVDVDDVDNNRDEIGAERLPDDDDFASAGGVDVRSVADEHDDEVKIDIPDLDLSGDFDPEGAVQDGGAPEPNPGGVLRMVSDHHPLLRNREAWTVLQNVALQLPEIDPDAKGHYVWYDARENLDTPGQAIGWRHGPNQPDAPEGSGIRVIGFVHQYDSYVGNKVTLRPVLFDQNGKMLHDDYPPRWVSPEGVREIDYELVDEKFFEDPGNRFEFPAAWYPDEMLGVIAERMARWNNKVSEWRRADKKYVQEVQRKYADPKLKARDKADFDRINSQSDLEFYNQKNAWDSWSPEGAEVFDAKIDGAEVGFDGRRYYVDTGKNRYISDQKPSAAWVQRQIDYDINSKAPTPQKMDILDNPRSSDPGPAGEFRSPAIDKINQAYDGLAEQGYGGSGISPLGMEGRYVPREVLEAALRDDPDWEVKDGHLVRVGGTHREQLDDFARDVRAQVAATFGEEGDYDGVVDMIDGRVMIDGDKVWISDTPAAQRMVAAVAGTPDNSRLKIVVDYEAMMTQPLWENPQTRRLYMSRILAHEMSHAAANKDARGLQASIRRPEMLGLEEGLIEGMTAAIMPDLAKRGGWSADFTPGNATKMLEDMISPDMSVNSPYWGYLQQLEYVRDRLGMSPKDFYQNLAGNRIQDRRNALKRLVPEDLPNRDTLISDIDRMAALMDARLHLIFLQQQEDPNLHLWDAAKGEWRPPADVNNNIIELLDILQNHVTGNSNQEFMFMKNVLGNLPIPSYFVGLDTPKRIRHPNSPVSPRDTVDV